MSGPEGVLIELNALRSGPTENHGSEPAVSDWQRLNPVLRWFIVPEKMRGVRLNCMCCYIHINSVAWYYSRFVQWR
jgi:hypothetical protein